MMMRSTLFLLITALPSLAQYLPGYVPNPQPLNYLPNYYNRQTQPLSPYLNMFGNNNPGVNYYYRTRPGTPAGGVNTFGQAPPYQPFVGMMGGGFLPQSNQISDGSAGQFETNTKPIVLRAASHPVMYGNQFLNHGSFASVYANAINRGGFNPAAQQRSTVQGLGNSPAPKR